MTHPPYRLEMTIDRTSHVPLHMQISDRLASLIADGALSPGTRLEDEITLARRLEVSRPTARQALQSLADQGLVVRRRGAGTRVTAPHARRASTLDSLLADLTRDGSTVRTQVLSWDRRDATTEEASALGLHEDAEVVHVRRLRLVDNEPVVLMSNVLPARLAPTADELEDNSLYARLRERHAVPATATQSVCACNAGAKEAELLAESRRAALLTLTRTTYDVDGHVLEHGTHLYRPSHYTFTTTLFAD